MAGRGEQILPFSSSPPFMSMVTNVLKFCTPLFLTKMAYANSVDPD